jgi:hypothetical protein
MPRTSISLQVEGEPPAIRVWRFDDAPKFYQDLSSHGGDETWLAVVPPALWEKYGREIEWAPRCGSRFGVNSVHEHHLATGEVVLIGADA